MFCVDIDIVSECCVVKGKTLQEIAEALGYKDRSTIAKIIKRMNE